MIFNIETIKHISFDSITDQLPEGFCSYLLEELDNSSISFGSNAETFMTIDDLADMMLTALDEYESTETVRELIESIVDDLGKLPKNVYISLGK